ncbi:YetF domain-containing protein [Pseudobacteroides cellulosolvens]|uniref:YetF C-terminal domain-containing protein n=1 Tax=Pseudobacteroides cellulosolvens ATCC 35603 = DSM 2933 TaxID=398512 RepID=A0A0L6JJS7_9FIRM|nr:DUF421 domain-containing protein [Pseudobacteroides cellulosolvens]KNY25637.1 protein of unknown function DUF421 [Pseudobacteroides cellulosolvens ATCC 35603 = DSM 2933]
MAQTIISSILRATIAYLLLLIIARFMGRKSLSQMTFFDFAIIITLGSVTANLAMGPESTPTTAATTLITLGGLAIITGYLHIKSLWVRKLTNSEPVTAIENGRIVDKNLKKVRFTVNELSSMLRKKNVFNYADVEFAIIENDGQLSVLPKSQKAPLTPSDLKISTNYTGLTKDLIIDGKVLTENLKSVKLDGNWLDTQLSNQGISSVDQVFYAGLDSSGNIYVSVKQPDTEEYHGQYGIE